MRTHIVRPGEHLSMIATAYGFSDPKALYNHPSNAAFKKKRPNPDVIHPGDVIEIPEKAAKEVEAASGKTHTFKVKLPTKFLHLVIRDRIGNLVKNERFELQIGKTTIEGKTTGEGVIDERIPADASAATLRIKNHSWQLKIGDLNPVGDTDDGGVTGAQMRLANLGYQPGRVDGVMGPRTRAAIRAFQKDFRLKKTGKLDSDTLAKLEQRHGS